MKNKLIENLTIFCIMGILFMIVEVIMRIIGYPMSHGIINMETISRWSFIGYTSLWMFPIGGLCGLMIGLLNDKPITRKIHHSLQVILGVVFIILIELITGIILNIIFKLQIWDYSYLKINLLGQISLYNSLIWLLTVPFGMWIDDVLRFYIANAKKPNSILTYYTTIFKKQGDIK